MLVPFGNEEIGHSANCWHSVAIFDPMFQQIDKIQRQHSFVVKWPE